MTANDITAIQEARRSCYLTFDERDKLEAMCDSKQALLIVRREWRSKRTEMLNDNFNDYEIDYDCDEQDS